MNNRSFINLPARYHLILTAPRVWVLVSPLGEPLERYRGELQPRLVERAAHAHLAMQQGHQHLPEDRVRDDTSAA